MPHKGSSQKGGAPSETGRISPFAPGAAPPYGVPAVPATHAYGYRPVPPGAPRFAYHQPPPTNSGRQSPASIPMIPPQGLPGGLPPSSASDPNRYGYNPHPNAPYRGQGPSPHISPYGMPYQGRTTPLTTPHGSALSHLPRQTENAPGQSGLPIPFPPFHGHPAHGIGLPGLEHTKKSPHANEHQGKLPPGRKKKGRAKMGSRPGRPASEGGSSRKGQRGRGRSAGPRRSTSGVGQRRGPKFELKSDEAPDRIVNPLLEIPSEASQNEPVPGSELLAITDLMFSRPDTYPLAYLGRLLGFDLPPPKIDVDDESKLPEYPTPLPDVEQLSFLPQTPKHDVFLQIPAAGPSLSKTSRMRKLSKLGDEEDQYTLDYMDPVYAHFLREGFRRKQCKAGNSFLFSKLGSPLKKMFETQEKVKQLADSLGISMDQWTFQDWSSSLASNKSYRPRWTLDDNKVYSHPPSQSFGVIASYQGHPIVMIQYKFQWYSMQAANESELVMIVEGVGRRTGTDVIPKETPPPIEPPKTVTQATTESANDATSNQPGLTVQKPEEQQNANEGEKVDSETNIAVGVSNEAESVEETMPTIEIPEVEVPDSLRLMLIALALEHARAVDVWYALWEAPSAFTELVRDCFRMVQLPKKEGSTTSVVDASHQSWICDLKKCSSKYAVMLFEKEKELPARRSAAEDIDPLSSLQERVLVKLPTAEEATASLDANFAEKQRSKRALVDQAEGTNFGNATEGTNEISIKVQVQVPDENEATKDIKLKVWKNEKNDWDITESSKDWDKISGLSQLEILRRFPLPRAEEKEVDDTADEVLQKLKSNQEALLRAESAIQPRIRSLMKKVVDDRQQYESKEARSKREEENRILKLHEKLLARRKEVDQAWQEQLEQDMNAVCHICNDGEVTPDNQILFCEACNVAVHQMCYGIEEVPAGDYYCIPCRHFGREKMCIELAKRSGDGPRISLPPLPIRCELCPLKKGAYIRTDNSKSEPESTITKWVHMACAKWQGLDFLENGKPDVVEDVAELKKYFRRMDICCWICKSKRGSYHKCRHDGCEKWMHVTCARAIGTCEVIHGEDVEGPVEENPWTLLCPDHSNVDVQDRSREPVPIENLIQIAKELPNDPMPEPLPQTHKSFNKQNGQERRRALADPKYENELINELLFKKFAGLRCEVCYTMEEDGKNLARCAGCQSVICVTCRLSDGDLSPEQRYFKCFSCKHVDDKKKAKEEVKVPQCQLCNQKDGLLLRSFAKPVNRVSYWKNNEKEFKKTMFAQPFWAHYVCAFWLQGLEVDGVKNCVDCSNVVMSNGKGFVKAQTQCCICGLSGGLKARCADSNCRARGEKRTPYWMHTSCGRQAGYEIHHEDDHDPPFYAHCYFHGGCEYNLRARLEDLLEIEKKRAGKKFSKADAPMTFADASRLLNHAIAVIRILGWAWRWAEHWVESDSNWEPLLEPGQKEENFTKKQLKIIDSTPESRAEDARKCRLAAFGAALRNRDYDMDGGFDIESLRKALRAVLATRSLVGPLEDYEIELSLDWLSRAYRSKAKALGLGEDRIPVGKSGFCLHKADGSPKYELGKRPLPGKASLEEDQVFEATVAEPDDFLLPEIMADGSESKLPANCHKLIRKKAIKYKKGPSTESVGQEEKQPRTKTKAKGSMSPDPVKRKVGRPKVDRGGKSYKLASRVDSVAELVPSAVKKRGRGRIGRGRGWTPALESPPIKRKISSPAPEKHIIARKRENGSVGLPTIVEYQDLLDCDTEDSVLRARGRRGRPPRFLMFSTFVMIGGKEWMPGEDIPKMMLESSSEDNKIEGGVEEENTSSTEESSKSKVPDESLKDSDQIDASKESAATEGSEKHSSQISDGSRGSHLDTAQQVEPASTVQKEDLEVQSKVTTKVEADRKASGQTGKRKKYSLAGLDLSNIETSDTHQDGKRRSSRSSMAKQMSLKEPDDNDLESEEIELDESKSEQRHRRRNIRGGGRAPKKATPKGRKAKGAKSSSDSPANSDNDDDASFHLEGENPGDTMPSAVRPRRGGATSLKEQEESKATAPIRRNPRARGRSSATESKSNEPLSMTLEGPVEEQGEKTTPSRRKRRRENNLPARILRKRGKIGD